MRGNKKRILGIVFCSLLFLASYFLTRKVNFMQNDDWYYYSQVAQFLKGDYRLLPEIAPTFYLQGLIGAIFAFIFGIGRLPYLTLAIGVMNIYIFYTILTGVLGKKPIFGLLLSSALFLNPLYQYSLYGFMTEQYFLFFLLLALYFFMNSKVGFFSVSVVFGFFVRQVSLVLSAASTVYYLLKKDFRRFIYQLLFLIFLVLVYLILFPRTPEMMHKTYQLQHFAKFNYIYSIFYGSMLYLSAFTLPFLAWVVLRDIKKLTLLKLVFAAVLFFLLQTPFKPLTVSWGEFPYFENTWERTGFLARDIAGTKYQFKVIYDLYYYWDLAAKVVLALFLSTLVFSKELLKRIGFFEVIFISGYFVLMFLTVTFYDRYLLVVIPLFMLIAAKILNDKWKLGYVPGILFLLFLAVYSYTLVSDFIVSENYVWGKAQSIVETTKTRPSLIYANSAWNEKNRSYLNNNVYLFSYDSPKIGGDKLSGYELVEEKNIDYPFNFHISPKVYLYKSTL